MRILLVEDQDNMADAVVDGLRAAGHQPTIVRVSSLTHAELALNGDDFFDLAVIDLKIPTDADPSDADAVHGKAVFYLAAESRPGMLTVVFSGFADEDFLDELIRDPRYGDPFGCGTERPVVNRYRKSHLVELIEHTSGIAEQLATLEELELAGGGHPLDLNYDEAKLLRMMLRLHGATLGQVRAVPPGLTPARVFELNGLDANGGAKLHCFAKIGPRARILEEERRYHASVAGVLPASVFAPMADCLKVGSGRLAAISYSIAGPDARSLFDLLSADEPAAVELLAILRERLLTWTQGGSVAARSVDEICTRLGAPTISAAVDTLGLDAPANLVSVVSVRQVQVRESIQHGDLHGGNVLVAGPDLPVLIDFGRTLRRVAAYDALTLEMSLFFHPDGRVIAEPWPSPDQARSFDDIDAYLLNCPYPTFVKACRAWAHESAVGDREVWAVALALALRNLRFQELPERALAVAQRALELLAQ